MDIVDPELTVQVRGNVAAMIRHYLKKDGHRTWGFPIYRADYSNDDEWARFLMLLRLRAHETLQGYEDLDLIESLAFTVFDDKTRFDRASTAEIRDHFKRWTETAPQEEQGTGPGQSQRYRYCIQMDTVALQSCMGDAPSEEAPEPPFISRGFVNLIDKGWEQTELDPEVDNPPNFEPLEDLTREDVGWMRVGIDTVMVSYYHLLRERHSWDDHEYRRPPYVQQA